MESRRPVLLWRIPVAVVACVVPVWSVWGTVVNGGEGVLAGRLPDGYAVKEAEFHARQLALEADLRRFLLSTLDRDPETRRELMARWMDRNAAALEGQKAADEDLTAAERAHGVSLEDGELAAVEAARPDPAKGASEAETLHWELRRDLAEIRHHQAGDPEAARERLVEWENVHGEEFRRLAAQLLPSPHPSSGSDIAPEPSTRVLPWEPPAEAPGDVQRMFKLQNELAALREADPSPLLLSPGASFEELDAWRARMEKATAPLQAELESINQQLSEQSLRRIAQEHPYENGTR